MWVKFKFRSQLLQQIRKLQILTANPELWGCTIFGPKKIFLENYQYHSHLPINPFHCAKFWKNSSIGSRVTRMRNFWAQNSPFPQMRIFFQKPVKEPCFFHSCLSTWQKSKSDIFLIVKYWRLKNTEISLVKNNFWL